MRKWLRSPLVWGCLLVLTGFLFLIQEIFNIPLGSIFWGILLGLVGLFFILIYINNRPYWWALIPGATLIGISLAVILDVLLPGIGDALEIMLVLGGIGAGFTGVYISDRRQWWAIIPAGVMFTLAGISGLGDVFSEMVQAGLLFFGLGITFAVLALLPTEQGRQKWARIPAIVLLIVGVFISAAAVEKPVYLVPVALIVGGLLILVRTIISGRK